MRLTVLLLAAAPSLARASYDSTIPRISDLGLSAADIARFAGSDTLIVRHRPRTLSVVWDEEEPRNVKAIFNTALAVVDAPVEVARRVALEVGQYHTFMPALQRSEVQGVEASGTRADLLLGMDIPVVSIGLDYSLTITAQPNGDVTFLVDRGMLEGTRARWEFLPLPGGKTLLAYTGWDNSADMGFAVRMIYKAQPDLEFAIPAAVAGAIAQYSRERIETQAHGSVRTAAGKTVTQPNVPLITKAAVPTDSLRKLASLGLLMIVHPEQRLNFKGQDIKLTFVTAAGLVKLPVDRAVEGVLAFERYPEFFPQVDSIQRSAGPQGSILAQWNLVLDFGLFELPIEYTNQYVKAGPYAYPFRRVKGDIEFIYGALEWVPTAPQESLVVFTAASYPGEASNPLLRLQNMISNASMILGVASSGIIVERQLPWLEKNYGQR